MPGAVGGHGDILVPLHLEAGDSADDAPGRCLVEAGIGHEGLGEGDGLCCGIVEEVIDAVCGNREVLAVGGRCDCLAKSHYVRLGVAGCAAVVVPAAVVAELELVGSRELEPGDHVLCTVGVAVSGFILVPFVAGACDRADHAPCTLGGELLPGIALDHRKLDNP